MVDPRKQLIDAIPSRLIGEFGQRGHHKGRGPLSPYDPWWWPVTPSHVVGNWGLTIEQGARILPKWPVSEEDLPSGRKNDVFFSLCQVPPRALKATPNTESSFLGSLGATAGCIMVLGERPSFNRSFADAAGKLLECIAEIELHLVYENGRISEQRLLANKPGELGPLNVHVTDIVKFRGPTGRDDSGYDSKLPKIFDGPDPERMITLSVECLAAEIRLLDPVMILRTNLAKDAMEQIRQRHPEIVRTTFAAIDEHPGRVEVAHWKDQGAPADWLLRIREKLMKNVRLAEDVRSRFVLTL
jgi:hypothetical protein